MADTTGSSAPAQFEEKNEGGVWLITPVVDLASMNWIELPARNMGAAAPWSVPPIGSCWLVAIIPWRLGALVDVAGLGLGLAAIAQ